MKNRGSCLLGHFLAGCRSQAQFAREIGVTAEAVNHLLHGRRRPSLDLAFRIAEASAGQVPVSAWRKQHGEQNDGRDGTDQDSTEETSLSS